MELAGRAHAQVPFATAIVECWRSATGLQSSRGAAPCPDHHTRAAAQVGGGSRTSQAAACKRNQGRGASRAEPARGEAGDSPAHSRGSAGRRQPAEERRTERKGTGRSVSRILLRRSSIYDDCCQPPLAAYPRARAGSPRTLARTAVARRPSWPCSTWGLPSLPSHLGSWWSLTPPFHPHPHLGEPRGSPKPLAVCSLWHCPAGCPGWALPTTLPCGVRTFLGAHLRGRRDRPTDPFRDQDTASAVTSGHRPSGPRS